MYKLIALTLALSLPLNLPLLSHGEDLNHLQQLLSTRKCPQCDLSGSGLVQSNLAGAKLNGANLVGANLSQANLSGADLSGANLTGASLFGANLTGANLSGAILTGVDLRGAYLNNANLDNTKLDTAYIQGTVGIPNSAGTPELFYSWGMAEAKQGRTSTAIENFNKALTINPEYAPAYLARSMAHYRMGQNALAAQDAQMASTLFEQQNNTTGYEAAQNFIKGMEIALKPKDEGGGNAQLDQMVQGIGSLLLQFVLPALGLF
jgi:uncharacterized protein YjbI with pentapeptide repeats